MEEARVEILERVAAWQAQFRRDSEDKLAGGSLALNLVGRACSYKMFVLAMFVFGTVCVLNILALPVLLKYTPVTKEMVNGLPVTPEGLEAFVKSMIPEALETLFASTFSPSEFYSLRARRGFEDAIAWFNRNPAKRMYEQSERVATWLAGQVSAPPESTAQYLLSLAIRMVTHLTFQTLVNAISFLSVAYDLVVYLCLVLTILQKLIGIVNSLARGGYRLMSGGRVVEETIRRVQGGARALDEVLNETAGENAVPDMEVVPGLRRRF